jgi:hypothetical protein
VSRGAVINVVVSTGRGRQGSPGRGGEEDGSMKAGYSSDNAHGQRSKNHDIFAEARIVRCSGAQKPAFNLFVKCVSVVGTRWEKQDHLTAPRGAVNKDRDWKQFKDISYHLTLA